jgi:endonuclease/exonuclease/phosphatase family metal-dependent hydrolase
VRGTALISLIVPSMSTRAVKVMSYNIKGHGTLLYKRHIEGIAAVIRDEGADVIGLQEVHRGGWKVRSQDQPGELEQLTGLTTLFAPSFGGNGFHYGNALLTRGRVVESRIERLPGKGEPRTLLSAVVDLDGFLLRAFVTHLAAWGRFGGRTRAEQAEAVARIVEQSDLPFVLMGDFNSGPTSAELHAFHSGRFVMSAFNDPIITHRATRQCLDYIFVDPQWEIREPRVVTNGPSDHWPLVATLARTDQA